MTGIGDITLDDITVVGSAVTTKLGTANITLDDITVVGKGFKKSSGTANITLDDITVVGTAIKGKPYLKQPLAGHTILIELNYRENNVQKTDYFSNNGYTTTPTDEPPNIHYLEVIIDDPFIVMGFDEPLTVGNLKLKNSDGFLDSYMLNRIVQGQVITLFDGYTTIARAEFNQVFTGKVKGVHFDDDVVTILLTDNKEKLNRDIQPNVYPDTTSSVNSSGNLIENKYNDTNAGKPKPLLFGECFNITPIQIDNEVYQFNDGSSAIKTIVMRDKGAQYISSIVANTDEGTFTITNHPDGDFTGDFSYATNDSGKNKQLTSVIKNIITHVDEYAEFDDISFSEFELAGNPDVGIYLTDKQNAIALLDELLSNVRATWFYNEIGKIELAQLSPPRENTITTTKTEGKVIFFDATERTFSGSTSYSNITVPHTIGLSNIAAADFCIEMLFKPNTGAGYSTLVQYQSAVDYSPFGSMYDWNIMFNGAGISVGVSVNLNLFLEGWEGVIPASYGWSWASANSANIGEWNHLKISKSGWYLNGVPFTDWMSDLLSKRVTASGNTEGYVLQAGRLFNGKIKEIRITQDSDRVGEILDLTTPLTNTPFTTTTTVIVPKKEPSLVIEPYLILSISLQTHDAYEVCRSVKMGVQKNWTVQSASSLSSIVESALKKAYKSDYARWYKKNIPNDNNYPLSLVKSIDNSYLTNMGDVINEVYERAELHRKPRFLMKVKCTGYWVFNNRKELRLGSLVKVVSARHGEKIGIVTKYTYHFISGINEIEVLV